MTALSITRKRIIRPVAAGYTVYGESSNSTSPTPIRHWEVATLINLSSSSIVVVFDVAFTNYPVGILEVYRMTSQNGGWGVTSVLFTYDNEEKIERTGFAITIHSSEALSGIIIKYSFTEGVKTDLSSGSVIPPPDNAFITDLLACWKFDNATVLVDEHFGYDGISTDVIVEVSSVLDYAYRYDITGTAYIPSGIETKVDLFLDDFTVEIWFNANGDSNGAYYLLQAVNDLGTVAYGFRFDTAGDLFMELTDYDASDTSINCGSSMSTSGWYHLVLVNDVLSGNLLAYVNATKEGEITSNVAVSTETKNIYLNTEIANPSNPSGNDIQTSRLALWKRALTQSEIAKLYKGGVGTAYSDFA